VENGTLPPEAVAEAIAAGSPRVWVAGPGREVLVSPTLLTCRAHGWDAVASAAALGIHRATLHRRLRDLGVSLRRMKEAEREAHDVARRRAASHDVAGATGSSLA
jgi:hypothetical protein